MDNKEINPSDISVRIWLEKTLELAEVTCYSCKELLQLVWISSGDDEDEPILNYFECPKCNREYRLEISFSLVSIRKRR